MTFDLQDASRVDLDPEEEKKKAQTVSSSRILTQEEFQQIQRRQAAKEVEGATKGKKRKHVQIDEDEQQR